MIRKIGCTQMSFLFCGTLFSLLFVKQHQHPSIHQADKADLHGSIQKNRKGGQSGNKSA